MNRLNKPILGLTLLLLAGSVSARQTCKDSITETTPTARFMAQDNGSTMLDMQTQLIWKRCSEGQSWDNGTSSCIGSATTYTWQGALEVATTLNASGGFASQTDWRVPNIKELASIVELKCYAPAINLEVFPNTEGYAVVWSSSPMPYASNDAWSVVLDIVNSPDGKEAYYKQVRLVRSGQ